MDEGEDELKQDGVNPSSLNFLRTEIMMQSCRQEVCVAPHHISFVPQLGWNCENPVLLVPLLKGIPSNAGLMEQQLPS